MGDIRRLHEAMRALRTLLTKYAETKGDAEYAIKK
ncbi:hypothetical protein LMG32289_03626 [Cupriavidus pampae]|uniref:30S ribosomal protein S15 n=1 Tax=Cupriavidus pampae TaxID=659251 RepID=A0ABN7YTF2_9BURK|nr:hypothetical protein LMG32289_03626 [Cupriavidus pampae]